MIKFRSTAVLAAAAASLTLAPAAVALPGAKHVPAPHVCENPPVRGGVDRDDHQHQTGKGHKSHGNGWGYGHGCGAVDGGDLPGDGGDLPGDGGDLPGDGGDNPGGGDDGGVWVS